MKSVKPKKNNLSLYKRGRVVLLSSVVVVLCIALLALVCRQRIYDWWRLRDYTPPTAIAQLAADDTMNSYTRHVFYVNHPKLLNTVSVFRQDCPEDKEDVVLGCYHVGQQGIYIYNVTDSQLQGVQQVTAAHEVLHAIYARLSPKAKNNLDQQLEAYYKHGLTDQRVIEEVQIYQRTEPTDVYDEMSCTFGTEIANLPAGLEAYYNQFFTNRAAIVSYEQQYVDVFSSREAQIASDDSQLSSQLKQINSNENILNNQLDEINSQRAQLQSIEKSNPLDYNTEVPAFNALIESYNNEVLNVRSEISAYNQLVTSRNSIAGALDGLDKAIDTRLSTQSKN